MSWWEWEVSVDPEAGQYEADRFAARALYTIEIEGDELVATRQPFEVEGPNDVSWEDPEELLREKVDKDQGPRRWAELVDQFDIDRHEMESDL